MNETHYLEKLFNPSSIAVIGASERAESVGMKIFKNLMDGGFKGALYPVNPEHKSVFGKQSFSSVIDIRNAVDLAIIITKASTLPFVLSQCGEKKINQVVIISAGFAESGEEGAAQHLSRSELEIANGMSWTKNIP